MFGSSIFGGNSGEKDKDKDDQSSVGTFKDDTWAAIYGDVSQESSDDNKDEDDNEKES